MSFNTVLATLIDELGAVGAVGYIDWKTAQEWPEGALEGLLKAGVLKPASKAESIECQGCEYHCFVDVVYQFDESKNNKRAFIICEEPDMQEQMGRIPVELEYLQQWKISVVQFARVVAGLLEFEDKIEHKTNQEYIQLGMLAGSKGRCWISLQVDPLMLEVNGYEISVQDLLFFEGGQLIIDKSRIDDYLNRVSRKETKQYTPSTDKRETGKLNTQAMYQDWRDEYKKLKTQYPKRTDTWIAIQISKMPISQGKSAGRIRKMMKN